MSEGNGQTQRDLGRLEGAVEALERAISDTSRDIRSLGEKQAQLHGTVKELARAAQLLEGIEVRLGARVAELEKAENVAKNRRNRLVGIVIGISAATSATAVAALEKLRIIFHTMQVGPPQ